MNLDAYGYRRWPELPKSLPEAELISPILQKAIFDHTIIMAKIRKAHKLETYISLCKLMAACTIAYYTYLFLAS